MAHVETLKNVPNAKVPEVKASYEDEGATVVVVDQGAGLSTLIATFPNPPASATAQAAQSLGATRD